MIAARDLANALHGVRRLLAFDVGAWNYFDRTAGGFWASFVCALILLPLDLVDSFLQYGQHASHLALVPYVIVELLGYVLQWTLFPFIMLYVARLMQRSSRYFNYLVPYNWLHLPLWFGLYLVHIAANLHPLHEAGDTIVNAAELVYLVAFFVYGTFTAGIGLQLGTGTALSLVVLDFVVAMITSELILRI